LESPLRAAFCLLPLLLWPASASAEGGGASAVAEGRRLAQEARFDQALAAFDRAAASPDLERADLVALLEGRAMVHHARSDDAAFERTARGLASISPDYAPSRQVPPRLARRLRTATEGVAPLALEATIAREHTAVVIRASLIGDAGELVTRTVVSAKVGDAAYADHVGDPVSIPAGPTEAVRYFVQALGPGGVVLASVGSAASPELVPAEEGAGTEPEATSATVPTPAQTAALSEGGAEAQPTDAQASDSDDGLPIWPFIVGGVVVAALVAAVIVAFVVPGSDTSPGIPGHPL